MKTVLIWLFILLFELSATAQSPSAKDPSGEKPTQKTAADYPDEPYIYEYMRGTMRYENDGTGTRAISAKIRVQNAAGLKEAGQLIFDYNAVNENIEIRSVKVTKADGMVIKAGAGAVQDLSAPVAREAPMYTDARQKHVTVPGVAVGDSVEYEVVTTIKPLMAGQFWQNWSFVDNAICLDEQVDLNVPRSRALKLKSPSGIEATTHEEGDRKIYHWATSNLRHVEVSNPFKDFKFDVETLLRGARRARGRDLMFSTFQTWGEVGAWYAQLERDRRVVTPEIRERADAIVKDQNTQMGKIQALYEWVSRNIRYVSLSFGVGRYQPHAAAEVLKNRYGDCKDKATLLEALLEAEGLLGEAVLINTMREIDPDVPTPSQFDHAINRVQTSEESVWLDSTIGVGPFGYLLPQLRGKQALVIFTAGPPLLQNTPPKLSMTTLYGLEVKGEVSEQGKLDATIGFETRGDLEVLMRLGMLTLPPGQISSLLQLAAQQANKEKDQEFSFSDFKNSDPTDTSKPFHMELHLSAKIDEVEFKKMLKDDDHGASTQELIRMLMSGNEADNPLLMLLPESATKLTGPKEYSLKLTFTLPVKDENIYPPSNLRIARDFGDYEAATSWEGHTLHASWRLSFRFPQFSESQAGEYLAFRKEIVESLAAMAGKSVSGKKSTKSDRNKVVATLSPPVVRSAPLKPSTSVLYSKAQTAIEARNWGNAERDLETVVKEAPEFEYGWSGLGRTRMALHKYSDAEAAFRKYLELAPNLSTPYLQLASALSAQEKYPEAVEVLEKDVAKFPKDAQALRQLGLVHLSLHLPERAVDDLEKAVSISSDNAYGHFLLGSAYVDFNKHDKAVSSFERAVSLDPSGRMLNRAAYRLAEGKTHLDKAESWSTRSILGMEVELNQVTLQSIQAKTATLLYEAGGYWDTMGWIKFQKNDLAGAEKYIRASWELMDDSTIGHHLARIYEAEGQKDKAIETYAQTLAAVSATRTPTDDEKEARKRLAALLGDESLVETRIKESKPRAKERRSVQIANSVHAEGIAQYLVIIGPGAKVADIQASSPDSQLDGLLDSIRAASIPQSFPDDTILKLPRTAVLACVRSDQPCKFSLLSAAAAARTFPEEQPSQAGVQ